MLYDFHKTHGAKHPGAVHATYLLYGTKRSDGGTSQAQASDGGDIEMASSMPESETVIEIVPTVTLSLVPEEQLKGLPSDLEPRGATTRLTFVRCRCHVRQNYFHPRLQPGTSSHEGGQWLALEAVAPCM